MKRTAIFLALMGIFLTACTAQRPLRGSGTSITKQYNFSNFSKVNLRDMDGRAVITAGAAFSVSVTIDDNLAGLLEVFQTGDALTVQLKDNDNNRRYIENSGIHIAITLPMLTAVTQTGNNNLVITGVSGSAFSIRQSGNGNTTITGAVDTLYARCSSNGSLLAAGLTAQTGEVKTTGNGNAVVNVSAQLTGTARGNGNIINKGKAPFDEHSSSSGNASLLSQPQ